MDSSMDDHDAAASATAVAATAVAASDAGWLEIEQTLSAMELPPVPPTSDPQRLLGYVLTILPKYTEMEMLATHLRLYTATLEQEMEHVRSHVRVLGREVATEREKKQFLERYAAQVVKERNELLHTTRSSKHAKTSSTSSHFAWHTCCKKNAAHALDLTPSIASLRGEKLTDATRDVAHLQHELEHLESQRRALDFLLHKTQREHDAKRAADHKHIQQLERQLQQRSMLFSNLERQLYDVECALAQHDARRAHATAALQAELDKAAAQAATAEAANAALRTQIDARTTDCNALTERLRSAVDAKHLLAAQIDALRERCNAADAATEALTAENAALQTTDSQRVRLAFAAQLQKLQHEADARTYELQHEVDLLRRELMNRIDRNAAALEMGDRFEGDSRSSDRDDAASRTHAAGSSDNSDNAQQRSRLADVASHAFERMSCKQSDSVTRRLFTASECDASDGSEVEQQEEAVSSVNDDDDDDDDVAEADRASDDDASDVSHSVETGSNASLFNWETFLNDSSASESATTLEDDHLLKQEHPAQDRDDDSVVSGFDSIALQFAQSRRHEADDETSCSNSNSIYSNRSDRLIHVISDCVFDSDDDDDDEEKEEEQDGDDQQTHQLQQQQQQQQQPQLSIASDDAFAFDLHAMLKDVANRRVQAEVKAASVERALHDYQQTLLQ